MVSRAGRWDRRKIIGRAFTASHESIVKICKIKNFTTKLPRAPSHDTAHWARDWQNKEFPKVFEPC